MKDDNYKFNGRQPASPFLDDRITTYNQEMHYGLTKREYFAGLVMQGICSSGPSVTNEFIASESVAIADALLKELEK